MEMTKNQVKILEQAKRIYERHAKAEKIPFTDPDKVMEFLKPRLASEEREHFEVMYLNQQHEFIEVKRLFSGTINEANVYPREIIKSALELNAAAMILAHNHPGGSVKPSDADIHLTDNIKRACSYLEIKVLDHIIVGFGGEASSLARLGKM
ncbi:hypothetical protein AVO42_11030 [Thiomicrospira sp. XS5]|uniref:JAB domain-containing protein n=1 Tax=Thiomicrospira sp. XS5 TaxID=1775636 RepID=UPI00074741DF|nr:DNA repair protein RadC [Thiomicrospira sp. XS5]KUJ75805.1 hypothetical protein AVO42_11030 [Thiomicrospira sp. XS5]